MRDRRRRWSRRGLLAWAALALALSGCTPAEDDAITIAVLPWAEVEATAELWAFLLEAEGVAVELTDVEATSPGGIVQTGEVSVVDALYGELAEGEVDVWTGAWLPQSHAPQLAEHAADIEVLGTWYEGARLTWAVPADSDVTSIADLAGRGEEFGGQIIGVEPGSGHVRVSREEVLPAYGLEDEYTLSTGSTGAMLAALDRAVALDRPIVVTLWEPRPVYGRYDLRNLDDPLGALGEEERIDVIVRDGFGADHPEIAEWLAAFALEESELVSLQVALEDAPPGAERQVVADWVAEHREVVDGWLGR
ncbi:MAG: glycine betaine ABC transporter substrate-binding protein [Nitriliruptoraceae bacterium]